MKQLKRMTLLFLLAVYCAGLLGLPAAAAEVYQEHEGLQISVKMDKEQYDEDEPITATITVINTNAEPVIISNLEQLIPEGYTVAEDSKASMKDIELNPERTVVLKVTFEKEAESEAETAEDLFGKLLYGTFWGIPNVLLITILLIAFVIFMLLT